MGNASQMTAAFDCDKNALEAKQARKPSLVVFSSLFPSAKQPGAGLFVRERMFRVGQHLPITVVAPTPWFPFQKLFQMIRPHFRLGAPIYEKQSGKDVWYPRFLSIPGLLKNLDGLLMALGSFSRLRKLKQEDRLDIIDAHFAYPDGYAAYLLSRWLDVPYVITLRGTETRHLQNAQLNKKVKRALRHATQVFSVSESLRQLAISHGLDPARIEVVGNGVDTRRFVPQERETCRETLGIPQNADVLISVGGLVPRKGFHRIIDLLPQLKARFPKLLLLIVGGPSAEGNNRAELDAQVDRLGLTESVRFMGTVVPAELPTVLSAADVFVLATSNEGWANVFLEAMACGLPVVTTDVGGNKEVVSDDALGTVVPFGNSPALLQAIDDALLRTWDRERIRSYAEHNDWSERITRLCAHFQRISLLTKEMS